MLRSVWARTRAIFVAAASVAVLLANAGPASAVTTPLNQNLVVNPSAEVGPAAVDGLHKVQIRNWQIPTGSNSTIVAYGTPLYPTTAESQRILGKHQFFATGQETAAHACLQIQQDIFVIDRNTLVDGGKMRMNFSVWMATFDSQQEVASAQTVFFNGAGNVISTLTTLTVTKSNAVFRQRTLSTILPAGTRKIRILLLSSQSHSGVECDTYFDKVSLKLKKET